MTPKTKTTLVLAMALIGNVSLAQSTAPPIESDSATPLRFNIGAVSDQRFRGIAQSSFKPTIQAGVDYSNRNGVYVGATTTSEELDLYAGYKSAITKNFSLDVGVTTYRLYSDTADKVLVQANTSEVYGALTFGIVTAKYSRSAGGNFIANRNNRRANGFAVDTNSQGSTYLSVSAEFDLGSGFTLTPHVGRQSMPNQIGNAGDSTDFSLTLVKAFNNGVSASLAVITTDAKDSFYKAGAQDNQGKGAAVVGVKYAF